MSVIHYTELGQMSRREIRRLQELVDECDMIENKSLSSLISPQDLKSVFCAYNQDDEMCAFLTIEETDMSLDLNELFVDYASRKQGVGKEILAEAKNYAKSKNFPKMAMAVGIDNKVARYLYEKEGFLYSRINRNKVVMQNFVDENIDKTARIVFETFGNGDASEKSMGSWEEIKQSVAEAVELNESLDSLRKRVCVEEVECLLKQNELVEKLNVGKTL